LTTKKVIPLFTLNRNDNQL